jgi:Chloride channel protein EriC
MNSYKHLMVKVEQIPLLFYLVKWLVITSVAGALIGSASALLLVSLDFVTDYRESHLWVIAGLPVAGLVIGLMYHYWGSSVVKGNNLIIEEIHAPKNIVPFKMAPLIYLGTVITHLFGGSAGREGTAVQMGGAIADQFPCVFTLFDSCFLRKKRPFCHKDTV